MRQQKKQGIRVLRAFFRLSVLSFILFFAAQPNATAQYAPSEGIIFHNDAPQAIAFDFYLDNIDSKQFNDTLSLLVAPAANAYTHEVGKPMLPVYRHIISIPESSNYTIQILSEKRIIIQQKALGCDKPLAPAPKPTPKSSPSTDYQKDNPTYRTDSFYGEELIQIKPLGQMRGTNLALLTIAPIRYNPASKTLDIHKQLSARIEFSEATTPINNPLLPASVFTTANDSKNYSNQLIPSDKPYTYLVVAPPRFSSTLQPLISWKRQEGYLVEEFYCENIGREQIKANLQQRYDNATPNQPTPLFILLVGDVQDIPIWPGRQHIDGLDVHRTDLFYAEHTGDALPDALIGRISVSDTATLKQIISKTINYEQYNLTDSNYLANSLLVAGKEDTPPAPTVTNGQVNYLRDCIGQHDSLHNTICYHNPESDTMGAQIQQHLRQGIGFVNYTAHCTSQGWLHPLLSNFDIDSLTLGYQPFISVNNCCRSNDVSGDCFGEHLLRKSPGGAVGVIGASNETLWEEDYYWSVGGTGEPTLSPQYMPLMPGAYDRLFHTHQEDFAQQAATLSQIVLAGNWAVTASGSPYSNFYWEIYSLLGDPSLMPYIGIPARQQLDIDTVTTGDATIRLHGTPGARVAATRDGSLVGICTIGNDGNGLMHTSIPAPDSILFTATAQFHKPVQKQVRTLRPDQPRLVVAAIELQHTDGEHISQLTLRDSAIAKATIRNIGTTTAQSHRLLVSNAEMQPALICETTIASLAPMQDTVVQFTICPTQRGDEYILTLETADTATYWQQQKSFDLLEPQIKLLPPTLSSNGTAVTTVKPTTTYDIGISLTNSGRVRAKELLASVATNAETSGDTICLIGDLDAGDTALCHFTLTTPAQLDSLTLTISVSHRTDTTAQRFSYPADNTIGIDKPEPTTSDIAIWPNPADNIVTFSNLQPFTRITIYDIQGRMIKEINSKNSIFTQYFTHDLRCGIYSVAFENASPATKTVKKLIITR